MTKHPKSQQEHRDQPKSINADKLFSQRDQVVLTFRGEEYRLRKTRNNKLLLTK